jgi:ribosomal protein S27AE
MDKEFELSQVICGGHEPEEAIRLKEGDREVLLYCTSAFSKIEFFYHHIRKWEYPFDQEPLTEDDRARLVAKIEDHYARKGWDVVIDRRRFCPHCHEFLARSQYDNWAGGICDFCGKRVDRFGNIV